jgi:gamma-glutamylcyclotransferase
MSLPVVGKAHEAGAGAPFQWFVYGSSLDVDAFQAWAGEHGYRVPDFARARAARLDGWRLAFDVPSRFWGGAVAGLKRSDGESVEGVLLAMPGDARGLVDHKEGAISGLATAVRVRVAPLDGGEPIDAVAFTGADGRRMPREGAPSRRFVETVLRGARAFKLSGAYLAKLQEHLARAD